MLRACWGQDAALVTADRKLARTPGLPVDVLLV
jgi:hypothetical protein